MRRVNALSILDKLLGVVASKPEEVDERPLPSSVANYLENGAKQWVKPVIPINDIAKVDFLKIFYFSEDVRMLFLPLLTNSTPASVYQAFQNVDDYNVHQLFNA